MWGREVRAAGCGGHGERRRCEGAGKRERERDDEGDERRGRKVKEGGAEKAMGWMQDTDMEGVALPCRGVVGVRSGGGGRRWKRRLMGEVRISADRWL